MSKKQRVINPAWRYLDKNGDPIVQSGIYRVNKDWSYITMEEHLTMRCAELEVQRDAALRLRDEAVELYKQAVVGCKCQKS